MYCLWPFYGIVRSSLLYSPLDQSNLVGGTVYCLWPFSGSVRHGPFLRRVTSPILPPLSGPTCIVYGRFTALFGRPFCIALSTNQILSAPMCISYGRFSALFRHPSLIFTTNQILSAPTCISYDRFSALFRHPSLIFNGMSPLY